MEPCCCGSLAKTRNPCDISECAKCLSPAGCPLPCSYGGCIFNKTAGTNVLWRTGSCSGHSAALYLDHRGIVLLEAGVFDDIVPG